MSELKHCINQLKQECNVLVFKDTSDYAVLPTPSGVVEAEIFLKPATWQTGVKLNFIISGGTVIASTKTDQNDNITNILSQINDLAFPFTNLRLSSALLYNQPEFNDERYDVEYTVKLNGVNYKSTSINVTLCGLIKCFNDAANKVGKKQINESDWLTIASKFYALTSAIYTADINSIDKNLKSLKESCGRCGCGC